ncbi:hypothetical protein [Actinoallomurus sp. NPDC050550]|uniref:hypothetical protein n=1 Tax=Actinoallomurus sp. NPDC050550 TaxID=3154937 RepID=UPI0033E78C58
MRRIVPYPVLVGEVALEVREARLDDVSLPYSMISGAQRVVALHEVERSDWETARLSVRLTTPRHELDAGPWSDVSCIAMLSERRTNVRTSTPLREEEPGTWAGEIIVHRDLHVARAELSAQVVGSVDGVTGRLIGSTPDSWTVDLQARSPVRHKSITTVWADFGDQGNPHLHSFRTDPWTVEVVGDEPVLYLNLGFEGLEALLQGTRLTDRPARAAIAAQIATDVWTALFNAAAYAIEVDGDRPEWPGGWRETTLRRMLPDVFSDRSPDDAILEIAARRRTGDGGGELQPRVLHAAAKQAQLSRNLGGFIRTVRKTVQEDE